ncbi:hypothetical protein E4U53_000805 [Claviceps sorghi]|nr:hypothetical protein E4U53_000805 [Claviceps sorghi]
MASAWLDSLSEDWVSQPGSDSSNGPLPPLSSVEVETPQIRQFCSRIPRKAGSQSPGRPTSGNSSNVLSERSANEINISMQRLPSKLSQEATANVSRPASTAMNGSIVRHSLHSQQPPSQDDQTPEWKRRLIHGDIPYGEQRDLFCSAAIGLQDIFKPPPENKEEVPNGSDISHHADVTFPSSPPIYPQPITDADFEEYESFDEEEDQPADVTPSPSPRRLQKDIKHKPYQSSPIPEGRNANIPTKDYSTDDEHQGAIDQDESHLMVPLESHSVPRKASGQSDQSDTRNEDFSPIMIGKHNDENGNIDFAPFEVPVDVLWQKLEAVRVNQVLSDSQADLQTSSDTSPNKPPEDAEKAEGENRIENFDFGRDGGSGDGSFYNRGLSSEMGADTSEMLPEESLQASTPKEFPSIKMPRTNPDPTFQLFRSPSLPRAPFPSPDKKQVTSQDDHGSTNSPLKLFGPYDTFTSQTLLRRISQFEERSESPSQRSRTSSNADQTGSGANATDATLFRSGNLSKFGENDLDGYEFRGSVTNEIYEDSDVVGKENVAPRDSSLSLYPLREIGSRGQSPEGSSELFIKRKRGKNKTSSQCKNAQDSLLSNDALSNSAVPKKEPGSDTKRPRTSPAKHPTPKRRRTLHRSDIAFGRDKKLKPDDSHSVQMHSLATGQKRKDALSGNLETANSEVLARRSILKPQSPISSRSPSLSHGNGLKKSPLRALRNGDDIASSDAVTETDRKPSIRTQDFVNQAAQIMAMIRNQVKPDLASLEESEEEQIDPGERLAYDADPDQDSTSEPFSRPPSREGNVTPWAQQRQNDPEIMSRLKKYQEMSDMGVVMTSSSARSSHHLATKSVLAENNEEQQSQRRVDEASFDLPIPVMGEVTSDLPNVRIISSRSDAEQPSPVRDFPSYSSNRSTYRTYRSSSSRGSESRRIIMPERISHLIPDRVGSMCLDKDKKIWIKRKESNELRECSILNSEDSEEDPFASIPDLSVDMTEEMQNLKLATAAKGAAPDEAEDRLSTRDALERATSRNRETLSPDQRTGFRAIGFANRELELLNDHPGREKVDKQAANEDGDKAGNASPSGSRRHISISFSSPIASVIRNMSPEDDWDETEEEQTASQSRLRQTSYSRSPPQNCFKSKSGGHSLRVHSNQAPMRQTSLRDPSFIPRPVSRIDEQDEDSTVEIGNEDRQVSIIGDQSIMSHKTPQNRRASLSFIFNHTPGNGALSLAADDSALIGRNVGKLSLSPLSEFTLNNPEQSFGFEVSYVMGQRHMATGNGSQKVLSMTIRELVDRLGEAEPEESFWEDITELDLHQKRLSSLHMLDEFCGRLITLDASANKLSHLEGIPSTVRELKVSHNLLTELSSWDHLMNLQYVDVSDNEVTSLSALKNLVHLRSLKADNNQLTSLDGLDSHDGLLSIRARCNKIVELDFATTRFKRLQDLDLSDNQISSVRNLDHLPELARLKLAKNRMMELPAVECMSWLKHLDVSDNELTVLDTSGFPNLHSVHADRNLIHQVCGVERTRRLDSLSLREQRGQVPLDLAFLASACEVRKLFLSGNLLQHFDPQVDFLNLQLLELANCGLQSLPEKMGQLMPNLRTLNVNLNALSALAPLQFVPRLKKLLVAGNRLADSTSVTQVLMEFPHLTQLDVRDNPMTLGFYAPVQALISTDGSGFPDLFVLPDAETTRDEAFASRLDEATSLRRRLHQVVLVASCRRLKKLDGLPVRRNDILAVDKLLQTLIDDGLIPSPEQQAEEKERQPTESSPTTQQDDIDEETMADEQARAQLEDEAERAWHHSTSNLER